jgi:hypothetical protein
MGVVNAQIEPNVRQDEDLDQQAAWHAHLGAWREQRFSSVTVDLARDAFSGDATLTAQARAVDIGDMIAPRTAGAPRWVPPDEVRLLAQGYRETFAQFQHEFVFNTTPADPYEVEVTDTGGSSIVVAVDDNDTSLKLATSLGPEWSTADEPYYIQVDGDAMKVTAIIIDTPAFIAAGVVDHDVNASLTPALPAGITPDVGQLLLCFAAIRNSGTGIPDTPTGWSRLNVFPVNANAQVFAKYYVTGDAAPTITFTGGAANADTSAQTAAFSGLSKEHAGGTKAIPAGDASSNSSAQNIAYPALEVFRDGGVKIYFGWKQDDWTSVATVGDAEIGEPDTTTGDDQGIVWDYDIYTTASDISAGSFTVTGGASAVSRGGVVALRPLQTATVERDINNAAASHTAGAEVLAWRLGVNGL